MDAAGWVAINDLLAHVEASRQEVEACVATNPKRRFQIRGSEVRATQGHSTAGTPVTVAALEASWTRVARTQPLYHGTRAETVPTVEASGALRPMARTHVHLADAPDAVVGKRANVDVLLVVDPTRLAAAGLAVFRSPNGVYLVREVPWGCITGQLTPP